MTSSTRSSLFRPWAAERVAGSFAGEVAVSKVAVVTSPVHQDSTVSTTTSGLAAVGVGVGVVRRPEEESRPSAEESRAEKPVQRAAKCHQQPLERRHQKRLSAGKSRKSIAQASLEEKSGSKSSSVCPYSDNHAPTLADTRLYAWPTHKSADISSGISSAFHPQISSNKAHLDVADVPLGPHVLDHLPYACSNPDLAYVTQYCCPDVNVDLLTSELALEGALLRGTLPTAAQMEEYARLLHLHDANLKGVHRKQRPKKFRCPHCQVAFSNNGQLKGHVRIHTGERPYKCDVTSCSKTFTRNEELTRHKRIHSGLRPYACATCGKRFGRKDHLKKHARTHQPQYHRQALVVPLLPPLGHPYPYLYGI